MSRSSTYLPESFLPSNFCILGTVSEQVTSTIVLQLLLHLETLPHPQPFTVARLSSFIQTVRNRIPYAPSQQSVNKSIAVWLSRKEADAPRATGKMSTPDNQSYLSAGINKLSAWAPRSPVIKPAQPTQNQETESTSADAGLKQQRGGDHRVSHRHRLSLRNYPRDCPPLAVQWFFAVDVPKRKPNLAGGAPTAKTEKPKAAPKKYSAFSNNDSRAIEAAFQKLGEDEDAEERKKLEVEDDISEYKSDIGRRTDGQTNIGIEETEDELKPGPVKVAVNEDFLFDVDIERRELGPAYWLGPIYEVRRGTWFYQGGCVGPHIPTFVDRPQMAVYRSLVMRTWLCSWKKAT